MTGGRDGLGGDRLERLYEEAFALGPEERAAFLDRACADDPDLREELESLLAEGAGAETFMEDVGRLVEPETAGAPASLVRSLAARYAIEEEVGRGGMAVVYRAQDLRHERKVALKVLRPELAAIVGGERFLAEIKTTANLQHPNILALFDSGEADGHLFYVMPFVEGESLRTRLDREHQLPIDQAVRIATSMADALDYAHRQGVVHRDIKPDNVLLVEGKPVIADFGIALAVSAGGGDRLTETGLSLGTPHYMSPEQATGEKHIGPATDLYALGCVLYEMLTGEPPFTGRTPQAILGRIITGEVEPVSKRRGTVPAHVEAALQKALEKVPADRFGSGAEFGKALSSPEFGVATRRAGPATPASLRLTVAGYALAIALTALGTWWATSGRDAPPEPVRRTTVPLPEQALFGSRPRLLDDGSGVVYQGPIEGGGTGGGLWVLRWASLEPATAMRVPVGDGVQSFDPSPDGREVVLSAGDSIRVQSLETSASRLLLAGDGSVLAGRLQWHDDGWIYFTNGESGLSRIPAEGGPTQVLTVNEGPQLSHGRAVPVAGGRYLLFEKVGVYGIGSQIALLDTRSGEVVDLADGAWPSVVGNLVFFTDQRARELRVAELDGASLGPPTTIVEDLWTGLSPDVHVGYDVSPSGDLLYAAAGSGLAEHNVPVWVGRDGREELLSPDLPPGPYGPLVRLSPEGGRLALGDYYPPMPIHVWNLPDGPLTPAIRDGDINFRFWWTGDGNGLYYVSNQSPTDGASPRVFRMSADGVGVREAVGPEAASASLSPDSAWWIYRTPNFGSGSDLMVQSTTPGRSPASWLRLAGESKSFHRTDAGSPTRRTNPGSNRSS